MIQTASIETPRRKFFAEDKTLTDLLTVGNLAGCDARRSVSSHSAKPIDADPPSDGYVECLADGPYPEMFVQRRLN